MLSFIVWAWEKQDVYNKASNSTCRWAFNFVVRCLQAKFVLPLLSHDPDSRPSADEILQNKLVIDFEETSRAYQKLRTHSRDRTVSNSSGNSSAGGDGPALPQTVDCVSW